MSLSHALKHTAWGMGIVLVMLSSGVMMAKRAAAEALPIIPEAPGVAGAAAGALLESYYVVLDGGGAIKAAQSLDSSATSADRLKAARARLAAIAAQHDALAPRLQALGTSEVYRFRRTINAIQVLAPASAIPALEALPGVVRVEHVPHYERTNSSSVPFIGAPAIWDSAGLNLHGEDIRVGIVDTGIDYTHANFGGSGNPADYNTNNRAIIEDGTFPTARIVGGHDFCGDAYNSGSSSPSSNTPFPDPDPLDCNGHGSHVAGTAGGSGVLANGSTFAGPYGPGLNPADFKIGPGVAPQCGLYALKVFGCSGSTQLVGAALEWAADPNDDDDFSDRLDVLNLSIGSSFGSRFFTEGEIISQLAALGCVVVGSAGNSFDTFFIAGGVGLAPEAISIAASIDTDLKTVQLEIAAPPAAIGSFDAIESLFSPTLASTGEITGVIVLAEPSQACQSLANAAAIAGNIALIDRGSCSFPVKVLNAQAAGAIAAIIVNNQDGLPAPMTGSSDGVTIPAVMISRQDGEILKANLSGLSGTLHNTTTPRPDFADQIVDFSSRGPVPIDWRLKPDVSAPGLGIVSTGFGTGVDSAYMSGTSMAAPHVAGVMALLRQAHPSATVAELKARAMNTAEDMFYLSHPLPQSRGGAGRVNVLDAAMTPVTAAWDAAPEQVSLSLGFKRLLESHSETHNIRLTNHTGDPHTFNVSVHQTITENGVTITPLVAQVVVPANGTALAPIQFEFSPTLFDRTGDPATAPQFGKARATLFEVSGLIKFNEAALSLRVPYHGADEAASLRQPPAAIYLGSGAGAAAEGVQAVAIPLEGLSAHPSPFVSAFVLGAESPNENYTDHFDAGVDLIAVGAATDVATAPNYSSANLYFAIATAADRVSPRWQFGWIIVWIDLAGDGTYEYYLYNGDDGTFNASGPSDAFSSILFHRATNASFSLNPINAVPLDSRETAHFENNVLVLGVPFSALGFSPGNTRINYVVDTYRFGSTFVDTVGPIAFDSESRPIDPAPHGISGAPVFSTGSPGEIQVSVDPGALAAVPDNNKLLILQHHNTPDNRVKIVEISLDPPPVITDGWMLTGEP